jgi:hypothetical protein
MENPFGDNPEPIRVINYIKPIIRQLLSSEDDETTVGNKIEAFKTELFEAGIPVPNIAVLWHPEPNRVLLTYSLSTAEDTDLLAVG